MSGWRKPPSISLVGAVNQRVSFIYLDHYRGVRRSDCVSIFIPPFSLGEESRPQIIEADTGLVFDGRNVSMARVEFGTGAIS